MSHKNKEVFKIEMKHSHINWGCENGSEGDDYYTNFILPFNIGDTVSRDDKQWTVTDKDWDYDNNIVYFTIKRKNK